MCAWLLIVQVEAESGGRHLGGRRLHVLYGGGVHVKLKNAFQIEELLVLLALETHNNLGIVFVYMPFLIFVIPLNVHGVARRQVLSCKVLNHKDGFRRDDMAHEQHERQLVKIHARKFEGAEGVHFLELHAETLVVVVLELVRQVVRHFELGNAVVQVQAGIVIANQKVNRTAQTRELSVLDLGLGFGEVFRSRADIGLLYNYRDVV